MSVDFNLKEKQWIHFFFIGGNVMDFALVFWSKAT